MKGLPTLAGGIEADKIEPALQKYLHFRRVYNDDGTMFSHSKIVCVDKKLMYVGSDNAYPCYNEEHDVRVEDEKRVGTWVTSFFDPYWGKCTPPTNEVEHFKPGNIKDDKYLREKERCMTSECSIPEQSLDGRFCSCMQR
jgi:phosphatidylserine/phosphatidylglycerophosphate/cardiolipin synthase-like enzyme